MKRPVVIGISVAIMLIVTGWILFSRTGSSRPPTKAKDHRGSNDSALESAREILQKPGSAQNYRMAIHHLNAYLDRNPEQRPKPPAHPDLVQKLLRLDAGELAE